jgi:phage portal protein BeeE
MSVDDYVSLLNQYQLGGYHQPVLQQTQVGEATEQPVANFEGLATGAYTSNGVVFACMLVRQLVFSSVRFTYQRMRSGAPSDLFGTAHLQILERPWVGGTTQDMLARMIQDADLHGNSYWTVIDGQLVRLRPDWVDVVARRRMHNGGQVGWEKLGYIYTEGGRGNATVVPFKASDVCHFAPIPDPLSRFIGMSWLTPILREIQSDQAMGKHQTKFFDNAATANMVVRHAEGANLDKVKAFAELMEDRHTGAENAYKTLHLYPGADVTVVGSNLKDVEFKAVRGAGETRIAAAAGVPPIIVGLSEGLASATYCGTFDDPVWTPRGIVRLGDVRPGDAVWSFVDGHVEARKVTWQSQTGVKPVYTIRTKNRTIRFTDNHPVLVRVPGNTAGRNSERAARVEWRRVDQLRVGDRVVQAQRLPDQGSTVLPTGLPATVDALQWLGAYTGDGCLNAKHGVRMCMPLDDRAREHYAALALRLFTKMTSWAAPGRRTDDGLTPKMVRLRAEGLTYRQIVDRMGLHLHPMSVRDRIRHATREYEPGVAPVVLGEARNAFQFSSLEAVEWHHLMVVTGNDKTKRVPPWVFELSEELRLAYLAGIVDSDGSIGKDGRLAVQFANRDLVEDVRMLLVSCGIACSNVSHVEYSARVLPNAGAHESYEAWRFVASSAVEVGRIPFADGLYRERVDAHQHRHRPGGLDAAKAGLHEDLGFYTIRSIEIGDTEPVFDIEVEGGHSFLVDGVIVHNSNYGQARRRLADGTAHPLWQNLAGCLGNVVYDHGPDVRLWYDASDVPFLREDEKDAADIQRTRAETVSNLITSGYEPDSVVAAVDANDFRLLKHTGMFSVQLQAPGEPQTELPTDDELLPEPVQIEGDPNADT